MALPLGSLVWIPHDDCFWPAEVVGIDGDTVTVDTVMERSTVPLSSVSLVQDGSLDGIHDMTLLNDLNEAALLHTVRTRFSRGEIYTYTGSILVAVNPFQPLAIYTPDFCAAYSNPPAPPEQLPPHIFAIAQAALHSMIVNGKDQSIIVSGESGAGKTESTKLLLEYLVAVSGEGLIERSIKVAQQILQAHPVLESFGNAKTVRNNNSSRFGKFIQLHFDHRSNIVGATITNYLLEKSRLVNQNPNERNYHILYELCAGATPEEKKLLRLKSIEQYHYLNQSGTINIKGVDDKAKFSQLKAAMKHVGIDEKAKLSIFRILSGILSLGNVEFISEKGEDGEAAQIKTMQPLEDAAFLWEVPVDQLRQALLIRTNMIRGELFKTPLPVDQATDTRDALSKGIYGRLFDWLVEQINTTMTSSEGDNAVSFIGILDIFGFEIFENNSFERNEKLQQQFIHYIFKQEQEEYEREQIQWEKVQFVDNAQCLMLIE
eukprot:TRINITY_DN190_c0_g1_i3.p2 TRINITY_DN190_c0_g1~~TRINITY_DN190_c0_g1_i3.p2  ORF type:complete len:489 (+),score=174.83 TRINITY_DN190_c0_g1_i3:3-1469(+)